MLLVLDDVVVAVAVIIGLVAVPVTTDSQVVATIEVVSLKTAVVVEDKVIVEDVITGSTVVPEFVPDPDVKPGE